MSRVLTFSRTFPAYHPKAGQQTYFVEKVWSSLNEISVVNIDGLPDERSIFCFNTYAPKFHTIRAGNRWKVGDKFSPRVWSRKPYRSKMITIAPDIEVKKVWEIEIGQTLIDNKCAGVGFIMINGELYFNWYQLALNDGLTQSEMCEWFKPGLPFKGQIICWNENINY